ncbi:uncharacterized protein wu:fc46h12 isoform X2 [Hypomesus transpacificus]|uniref:uncharacterized protein wu:fc46h12 isoform X2 n=1 Tax=Hypomesus transpacificus TaxID=137520 RepID=UPI001F07BF88|nr:uncharacterized protein wu:fc46h12 isoform X2 [Hypomesus transpacificus]
MRVKSLVAFGLIVGVTFFAVSSADPLHAQCKVIWLFGVPCRDVYVALVNQIKAWRTRASCESGGENCLYELLSSSPILIKAKHTSPTTNDVDDLRFSLYSMEESSVCRVTGEAVSESWVDLMDNGTSYCSLHNLVEGSGLSQVEGYKEYTNEWICLEYTTTNCSIY